MVFSGEKSEEMERSLKPLHNFDLPCLKWGNQKVLRCMKADSTKDVDRKMTSENGRFRSSDDRKFSSSEKMKTRAGDGDIEATREKLMFDFQTEVCKMKDAILKRSFIDPSPPSTAATQPTETESRPWNLRSRRGACNDDDRKPNECKKSPMRFGGDVAGGEKRDRGKFSVSLCRREVEEDFTAMTGRRLPRKPKKRPRVIQKQLDTLFPGLWLTEITGDLYRVPDDTETAKR